MEICIIGGGPSGMLASILIKRERPDFVVKILERNDRVGKKLLATGNGRCNYTNVSVVENNFHSTNRSFPMKIVNKLNNTETIELLKTIGIYPISESDGRVFPLSLQGSSVLDLLRLEMKRRNVEVITDEKIDSIRKSKGKFVLRGNREYLADIVVVATGGMAMPVSGSDGIGYRFAKEFGHNIIEQNPTIVQLESDYKKIKQLKGVRINTDASLYINDEKKETKFGDVLFTDYGLSGPAVLDLSREAIIALKNNKKVSIGVNLVGIPKAEIYEMILQRSKNMKELSPTEFFIGIINKRSIQPVLDMVEYFEENEFNKIHSDKNFLGTVTEVLSDFKFNISGYKGFGNAQATTGGVDTNEINEESLESKLQQNLYFIGEVLDVDGDCGGYNLQWAWSSAYVAALDITRKG